MCKVFFYIYMKINLNILNRQIIRSYVNNFRITLSKYLKPNLALSTKTYICEEEGVLLAVDIKKGGVNTDKTITKYKKISEALQTINQNFIGGDLSGVHFGGTNIMASPGKILIIKDNNPSEWNDVKLLDDISSIVFPQKK